MRTIGLVAAAADGFIALAIAIPALPVFHPDHPLARRTDD